MVEKMPLYGISRVETFEIETNDSVNETLGGSAYATEWAQPNWEISMSTTNLPTSSDRYLNWRSFLDNLRGVKKSGLFFDPRRPFPVAYLKTGFGGLTKAVGGAAFTGQAIIDGFLSRYEVDLLGVPANFVLKRSDYISFMQGEYHSLHRIKSDVTGSALGQITVEVEPRIPLVITGAAEVHFDYPACQAIITPKSIRDNGGIEHNQISFRATSIIIPGTA